MSKSLEALKNIKINCCTFEDRALYQTEFAIIEKELKRLEELETMYSNCVIEGAKQKKALEIIKELFDFQPDKFSPFKWKKLSDIPQEKIDLLKEVLL